MPEQTEFKLRRWNRIAILTVDNGEDHTKPTVINLAAWDSLGRATLRMKPEFRSPRCTDA